MHVEVLVEEESAASLVEALLPKIVPSATFAIIRFQGKVDMLRQLPARLRGYASMTAGWPDLRLVVLVDRDDDDCRELKRRLERVCREAGLTTKASSPSEFLVVNRIAVEELEAWFFGDVPALVAAYPRLPRSLAAKAPYRDPDAIRGGTWEALERELNKAGYHLGGLRKVSAAQDISKHMVVARNRSRSFQCFVAGVRALD